MTVLSLSLLLAVKIINHTPYRNKILTCDVVCGYVIKMLLFWGVKEIYRITFLGKKNPYNDDDNRNMKVVYTNRKFKYKGKWLSKKVESERKGRK